MQHVNSSHARSHFFTGPNYTYTHIYSTAEREGDGQRENLITAPRSALLMTYYFACHSKVHGCH
jgi:hypothetical protein